MPRLTPLLLLAALTSGLSPGAEILDRVAVSIENTVITMTEVTRQIRITALLNNEPPDFSSAHKRETAERLVDQALIRREISISRYAADSLPRGTEMYKVFRQRYKTAAEYQAGLVKYQLADDDVQSAFNWQATLLDFVEVRFRPGVTVPDEVIRAYYDDQIRARSTPEAMPTFEESRLKMEEILTQQRVDNALDRWLGQTRTQSRIRYRQEALQ